MDEQFLHYIWKHQKFDYSNLSLVNGQKISVFHQGNHNQDAGPDFEEARIRIDDIEWAGQVEIHLNSSDWISHNHQNDPSYDNVILHVVWNYNREILVNNIPLPTLELKNLVNLDLYERYKNYLNDPGEIPCSASINKIPAIAVQSMRNRVLVERLESKANRILDDLKSNNSDWEETAFKTFVVNFGFSVNKDAFSRLSELLPFSKVKRTLQNQKQAEAVFFGQAGFLEESQDPYREEMRLEYEYLSKKLQLSSPMTKAQWKFGKLRPANFPTVRLAQLSSIYYSHPKLFTLLIETSDIKTLKTVLLSTVSNYWQTHYDFNKERKKPSTTMGISSFEIILINTVAPLLAAYSKKMDEQKYMDRALALLESLKPEKNRVTNKWNKVSVPSKNAFDSQASIELYKSYCIKRKCLSCTIGVTILDK